MTLVYPRRRLAFEAVVVRRSDDDLALKFLITHDLNNPTTAALAGLRALC
jgi:hypothetical protein